MLSGQDASGRTKVDSRLPLGMLAEGSDKQAIWSRAEAVARNRLSREVPELAKALEKPVKQGPLLR